MAIPGFFKQNKPRGFNYVPRYYDPVKEELKERRRTWSAENGATDTESPASEDSTAGATRSYRSKIMRGDMKNYFHRRTERVQKYTMIRILVIAMIMILAIYLYLRF